MLYPTGPERDVKMDRTFDAEELSADPEYRAWCQEYENGRWEARIAEEAALDPATFDPDPPYSFAQKLFDVSSEFLDSDDADMRGLAEEIATLAHLARHLEASSWSQFVDRRDCLRDSRLS